MASPAVSHLPNPHDSEKRLLMLIDAAQSALAYAGAGHSGYLLRRDEKLKQILESTGPPFGWFPLAEYSTVTLIVVKFG